MSANTQLISGRTRTNVQHKETVERRNFFFIEPAIGVSFYDGYKDPAPLFMANLNAGWRHKFSQHHNWDIVSLGLTAMGIEALFFKAKTGYRLESNKFIVGKSSVFFRIGAGLAYDCFCLVLAYDLGVGVNVNKWFNIGLILDSTIVYDQYIYLGIQFGFQL